MDYPDDADGAALRRVAEHGSDMSKPMEIDFMLAAPDEAAARAIARAAEQHGYGVHVSRDSEAGDWTCYCTRTMLATYDGLIRTQEQLDALSRRLGGYAE